MEAAAETPEKLRPVPALVADVPVKDVPLRLAKPPSRMFLSPIDSKEEFAGTCVTAVEAVETANLQEGSAEKDGAETELKRLLLLVLTALEVAMLLIVLPVRATVPEEF